MVEDLPNDRGKVFVDEKKLEEEVIVVERDDRCRLIHKEPKTIKKDEEEIDDEVVLVEEETRTKKMMKPKKEKERIEIEVEEIMEEEEQSENHKMKMLKPKRPKKGTDDIEYEEVEVLELTQDKALPSVPVNISSQQYEIVPLTQSVEQASGKPDTATAKFTIDTMIALMEEYVGVQETEDKIKQTKSDERKASISISPLEPYSITEPNIQATHGEFQHTFKPTTFEATSGIVSSPKESLQVTETLPNDAKLTSLDMKQSTKMQQAEISLTLREATAVSETTVNQSEISTENYVKPTTVKAEDTILPNVCLSIYEVNEGMSEDKLEQFKTISAQPRVNLSTIEPLTIEEVQTENKTEKYYPELIVPTEIATTTVVSQKLFITEEMNAPEKEGEYMPRRLPASQNALVGITEGSEAPIVDEQSVQEMEEEFAPDKKIDMFEADRSVNLMESVTISTVDTQNQETDLVLTEMIKATADLNVIEKCSIFTTETMISEEGSDYKPQDKPVEKLADRSILPLDIGTIMSTVVQESEGIYAEQERPTSIIADTSVRPEEYVTISEVQTADLPSDFNKDLKYVTENSIMTIQLIEAKTIQETLTHDREERLEESVKPEGKIVDMIYDSVKGIEVFQTTSVDREGDLRIFEMPESHRGKIVPTHSIASPQVEETRSEDHLESIKDIIPVIGKAKIEHDNLTETIVDVTVASEGVTSIEKDKVPESKFAAIGLNEIESIKTTELIINESEIDYEDISKMKSVFAETAFMTQSAIELQEVRTESPTDDLPEDVHVSGTAQTTAIPLETITVALQELAEKEDIYHSNIKPMSKMATIDLTETRPGASIFEVVLHDSEKVYHTDEKPQNCTAMSMIDSHTIAMTAEVMIDDSAGKVPNEMPKIARALKTQDEHSELTVVETNIGETEKSRIEEIKPVEQKAGITITTLENLTVMEIMSDHKEEKLVTDELAAEKTITINLTSSHEVAQTEETIAANNLDALSASKPDAKNAILHQTGLEIVQQTELIIPEMESALPEDVKPDQKIVDVNFTEGESVLVLLTHAEDKEGQLEDRVIPKMFEASVDFEAQAVASKYEILSDTQIGEFTAKSPLDAKSQTKLLPFETVIAEEVHTRETEAPLHEFRPDNKIAELGFQIGESVIVSSIETGDKEKPLDKLEKPEEKLVTYDIASHPVAEAAETIAQDATGQFKPDITLSATASIDHIAYRSLTTLETSTADKERIMEDFTKPDEKLGDVAFQEAQTGLHITEIITSDKEKDYVCVDVVAEEKATPSVSAHRVAELSEIMTSSITDDLREKAPTLGIATEERTPFEGLIQSQTVVSEKEKEFMEKPTMTTNKAEVTIDDMGNVTSTSEVFIVDKESSLTVPEEPLKRQAATDICAHSIAEKTEVTADSTAGTLEQLEPTSAAAVTSQIPLEFIIQTETQLNESEGVFSSDKKPTGAIADLCFVEDQGLQVSIVTMEDKESDYIPKELPDARMADKSLVGGHLVAETTETVMDFSTKGFSDEKPVASTAILDQILFTPLTNSQMIIGEHEDRFVPDMKPDDHMVRVDIELGRSTITISEVTTGDKEKTYIPDLIPSEKLASVGIDSTHEIAETTATNVEDAFGIVKNAKIDIATATSTQEVLRSILVSQEIPQDRETLFEGKFKPNVKDVEITVEAGKTVSIVTEVTSTIKEEAMDSVASEAKEAFSTLTSGHEVAEQSEILTNSTTGEIDITKATKATAKIGQTPFETVQLTEEFFGEKESERIETKAMSSNAKIAVDEQSSIMIATTETQDNEIELALPSKPRKEMAQTSIESKEVAQQSEIMPKESIEELSVLKPTIGEAKKRQETCESVNVTLAIAGELGTNFIGQFTPNQQSATVSFVEKKSVTVDELIIQDKEETASISQHIERVANMKLTHVGQDVAQNTEITVDESMGIIAPFETIQKSAHTKQDTLEPLVIEEVPVNEIEGSFVDYPKSISSKVIPTFQEGYGVTITEITSGEKEKNLEEQKMLESRKAETSLISEHASILTTVVDSSVDVKSQVLDANRQPQMAISSQDMLESVSVQENLIEENEIPFEGRFKPLTHMANIDIQEVKSLQVSQTITEDKEESFEGTPKIQGVHATPDINMFETIQKSEIETIQTTGEVKEQETITSLATVTQTTMESLTKIETTTAEREDTFQGEFKPKGQKGVVQIDGLSTVSTTEILFNETEELLTIDRKPKDIRALANVSGREVAQISEVETIADTEEFKKFLRPEYVQSQPQFDTCTSLIVSHTVSSETENLLPTAEVPQQKSLKVQLDGREIAQTSEMETIMTVEDFVKIRFPEEQKSNPKIEELIPLQISHVASHETEQEMPSAEKPSMKKAEPSFLGREIAETSEVETLVSAQKIDEISVVEEKRGTIRHDEMTSLIISQTVPDETEHELQNQEKPSTKTAQSNISGHDVAETTQILTLASFTQLTEKKPEEQKGKPEFEELLPMTVAQVVFNENEEDIPIIEKPNARVAQPNILTQETAETSQVIALSNTGEIISYISPAEKKGVPSLEEMSSLIISQTTFNETEELLESQTKPSAKVAELDISSRDAAETSQIIALQSFDELFQEKPIGQRGQTGYEELTSVTVSQIILNETEQHMPDDEKPSAKIAQPDILGRDIAEISEILTLTSADKLSEDKVPEEKRGQSILAEMSSLIISQIVSNETEDLLLSSENPSMKTAKPDVSGHDVAETSQTIALMSSQELSIDKPGEQKGQAVLEEHSSVTVSQVLSNEVEEELPSSEKRNEKKAESNLSGRGVAESSEVTTHFSAEELPVPKMPESVKGNSELDEMISLIVCQTVFDETEVSLPIPQIPTEVTAKSNLLSRETAEITEVTTVSNAEKLFPMTAPEEHKGEPRLNEMSSVIVSQTLFNECEMILPSSEIPSEKTAESNLSGREIAQTSEILTMVNTEELKRSKEPEKAKGMPGVDTLSSLIVSQIMSNEAEMQFTEQKILSEKTAQEHLSGRDVAITSHVMTLTATDDLITSENPAQQKGESNIEELSSVTVSQIISNEFEKSLPSIELPNQGSAKPSISAQEVIETTQITTLSNADQLIESKKPESQTIQPTLYELSSLSISQVDTNETENVLSSSEIPSGQTAQSNISGREIAQKCEVITLTNAEKMVEQQKPDGQQGRPELEGLNTVTISEILSNEMEAIFLEREKPKEQKAIKQMDSIEVAETTEIITGTLPQQFSEQSRPDKQKGQTNLEELVSLSIAEITQGETEDVLLSTDIPLGQTADLSLSGRPVAQMSQILTTTIAEDIPSTLKPDVKKIKPEQIPCEIFEQMIQQIQETESILTITKKIPSAQAQVTVKTSTSVEVTEVVADEKESKDVVKGIANQVNAQPDVMESQVAITSEIQPKSTVLEFDTERLPMKVAKQVDEEKRSIIVTELGTYGEFESEIVKSIEPFTKLATVLYETEHLEQVVGEYSLSCARFTKSFPVSLLGM